MLVSVTSDQTARDDDLGQAGTWVCQVLNDAQRAQLVSRLRVACLAGCAARCCIRIGELIVGSVTRDTIHRTKCDIMVVPPLAA